MVREASFEKRRTAVAEMGQGDAPYLGQAELGSRVSAREPGVILTGPRQNQLLASLPDEEWTRWSPLLERVDMPLGSVVYEAGVTLPYVYFPTTSIVSLLYAMENGASAEIAVVGN